VFAEIKVYTVSGRLIQVIPGNVYSDRFVKIFWDCHDRDGSKLGNGTYFYKVIAKTLDGKFSSEALGKLSIVR
jgi:flagellar hook assembly protein FlgD